MNSRERIKKVLQHQETDRIPIHDSPWGATVSRWRKEGLPDDISPEEYFGYEIVGFGADITPRYPVKTLEKNEEFIIETTPFGGIRKNFRDYTTTPEIIDYKIKSKKDWEEVKERLYPDFTRVDWASGLTNNYREYENGKFIVYTSGVGYDLFQSYIRTEQLLIWMIEDPDWIREMFMTSAQLTIEMAKMMIEKGFRFDGAWLFDDMGYRNTSLFSPQTYCNISLPVHKMLCDFFHSKGLPVILHSCGNVKVLIPHLIEAGFDCLQPLEVKAGMDLIELKKEFGDKLSFMGGIDVRLMSDPDQNKIENEIKTKINFAKKHGGYIYHSDHSVPNNVSFQQYKRVIELVKKYGQY